MPSPFQPLFLPSRGELQQDTIPPPPAMEELLKTELLASPNQASQRVSGKKKKKFLFCKLDNIYFEEQSTLIVSKRKKGVAFTVKTSERKTQLHLQACFTAAPALLWLLLGTAQKPKVQKQADTLCMRRCNAVSTLSTRYFAWGFFFFFFSCFGVLVWFFFFKGQN